MENYLLDERLSISNNTAENAICPFTAGRKNLLLLIVQKELSEAREDDEEFQSPVDLMFERLEEKDPEHFAVKQYKKYKLAAGKTAKSILISCGARLAPFDSAATRCRI